MSALDGGLSVHTHRPARPTCIADPVVAAVAHLEHVARDLPARFNDQAEHDEFWAAMRAVMAAVESGRRPTGPA